MAIPTCENTIVPPVTELLPGLKYKSPNGEEGVVVEPLPRTIVKVPLDIVKALPSFRTSSLAFVVFEFCPLI